MTPTSEPKYFFANELAAAFLESQQPDATEEDIRLVQDTAFLVGQHLADRGAAGDWSQIDSEQLYRQLSYMSEREVTGITLTLIAMFGWMGSHSLLPPNACVATLLGILQFGPQIPYLQSFAKSGIHLLETIDVLDNNDEDDRQAWN